MNTDTLGRVMALVADMFNANVATLSAETTPDQVVGWDSLQNLNVVIALEQEFALQLGPDEIAKMTSVGAIADLVDSLSD